MSENIEEQRPLLHSQELSNSPERGYEALISQNDVETNDASQIAYNDESSQKRPQYIAAFSATLTAFAAGIVLGWTSPISKEIENGHFNNISVNADQMGWIGSSATIGALLMCIPTGFLCDLLGRKTILLSLIIPFTTGWSLLTFANNITMLYFGRIICGLAVGSTCIAAPLYTSEIAQKEIRGTLGSYFQLMIVSGVFYAYFIGNFLRPITYTIMCGIVPFVAFAILLLQPESPLFLVKTNQIEKAMLALAKLRGPNFNVEVELHSIRSGIRDDNLSFLSTLKLFQQRNMFRALVISFGLMFFQQFSGINAIIFYTGEIFASSGIKFDAHLATICVGAFQVVATFISSLVVDKLGRKKLLIISGSVMSLSTLILGVFYSLKQLGVITKENIGVWGIIPVISLCVFVVVFSLGYGPIPWMISSEIFTAETKSFAGSAAGTFNWFLAFLITKFYLNIVEAIKEDATFYVFSVFSLIGVAFVSFFVIETKGKSIGQIQSELSE